MKILILEPGAWGTTLGILLAKKNKISFWYENQKLASKIAKVRENDRLSGIKIPEKIIVSSNLKKVDKKNDLIINASPSFNFRKTLLKIKKLQKLPNILGIAKGIEKETLRLPSQIAEEVFGKISYAHLSGPGFAREVIKGESVKEVIAARNTNFLKKLKELFKIKPLKILTTTDLIGVQLAGAAKNSLAIVISLVEAGCREVEIKKIRPKLIKLSLEEMIKIGKAMKAKRETFFGPAGLEDLILTSGNQLSRNFQFGQSLYFDAQKMREDIKKKKITVEGFDATFALYKLGKKYDLNLPVINEAYKVIYRKVSPKKTIKNLIKLAN